MACLFRVSFPASRKIGSGAWQMAHHESRHERGQAKVERDVSRLARSRISWILTTLSPSAFWTKKVTMEFTHRSPQSAETREQR